MGIISDLVHKAYIYQNGEDEGMTMTSKEAIKMLKLIKGTVYLGNRKFDDALYVAIETLRKQKPLPVESSIDHTWGIKKKVPCCPICESFLTVTHFIGDGKKISYCEHCGQAVSWEEWEDDE